MKTSKKTRWAARIVEWTGMGAIGWAVFQYSIILGVLLLGVYLMVMAVTLHLLAALQGKSEKLEKEGDSNAS